MIYQIAMTQANLALKLAFLNCERDNEQGALEAYVNYREWLDIANNSVKGKYVLLTKVNYFE